MNNTKTILTALNDTINLLNNMLQLKQTSQKNITTLKNSLKTKYSINNLTALLIIKESLKFIKK